MKRKERRKHGLCGWLGVFFFLSALQFLIHVMHLKSNLLFIRGKSHFLFPVCEMSVLGRGIEQLHEW